MEIKDYRKKVMNCWLGKAVGGTLGQPYEGYDGPLNLDFYFPVPTDMIPNDDLDLQVLWACVLDKMEKPLIDRDVFADAWLKHVAFPWDEYAIAIRNLRNGIRPPYSGIYDNWFIDGLGAAIRSEIWACLAPGNPALAAKYSYEDACVDHTGDGIYAEVFLAALESAAFCESNIDKLIDAGLKEIPADSRLALAIADTRKWCAESNDFKAIRAKIMEKWGCENFTDVVMNLPFVVMALLLGNGDFSRTICLANNCGSDADCTAASAGAIMGIAFPDSIEEKWLRPIGRKLVINDGITGINPPATLDGFTDMIISLKERATLNNNRLPAPAPDYQKFELHADAALFTPWIRQDEGKTPPKLPAKTEKITLPGFFGSMPAAAIPINSLYLMRFKFELKADKKVRFMLNSASNNRAWIDGEFVLGREEGGRMAPSFHRAPLNQYKELELKAGKHEVMLGLAPAEGQTEVSWVFGFGNAGDKQWLTDIEFQK